MVLSQAHAGVERGHYAGKATTRNFYSKYYGILPFIRMLLNTVVVLIFSNTQGNHLDEMKCHCATCTFTHVR